MSDGDVFSDSPPAEQAARFRSILEQAGELARLLMKSPQAPRALTSEFLHARKRFTPDEKRYISALAYHALRCWRPARAAVNGRTEDVGLRIDAAEAKAVTAAALLLALSPDTSYLLPAELHASPWSAAQMREAAASVAAATFQEWKSCFTAFTTGAALSDGSPGVAAALPDWILPRLITSDRTKDELLELGLKLCEPAPLTLRVNLLRVSREDLLDRLSERGIAADPHPLLPAALVVRERRPLLDTDLYRDGLFEVQDAGSQLISYACGVVPGSSVYDACAGGGGKSIHLLDLMRDRGRLLVSDIERNKLRGLRQRAARLAAASIETLAVTPFGDPQNPAEALPEHESCDCVLVDAPCSGFGTVRRNPALKWRLQERTVARLNSRQRSILARNATYVRPGGILVYATCSLLPEENDDVVAEFLSTHNAFSLEPLSPVFRDNDIHFSGLPAQAGSMTVSPLLLDSDGYYLARMRRR